MVSEGSVTLWMSQLKAGEKKMQVAAQKLWERYYAALLPMARQYLHNAPRRTADEEDVVLSAFERFFRKAAEGKFSRLDDRDDLWQVLLMLTERSASNQRRDSSRQKRGGGEVRGESALDQRPNESGNVRGLEQSPDVEPTPDFAAEVTENFRCLLDRLQDEKLRQIALWKLEGYTNEEIADQLHCSVPTVERRFQRIREIWRQE